MQIALWSYLSAVCEDCLMVCVMVEFNTCIILETVHRLQDVDTRNVADSVSS